MSKGSSNSGSANSASSGGLKVNSAAKAGLNPGANGVPVFDDKLQKSVTPVPYSGQKGY
jgi:hypothetical protein